MKRYLMPILVVPVVFIAFGVTLAAGTQGTQPAAKKSAKKTTATKKSGGKVAVKCPAAITAGGTIVDCPDTGCGPSLDPNLNKQKNLAPDPSTPLDRDIEYLSKLPDPVPGYKIGDPRTKLRALGEGKTIRIVAYALIARRGSRESCNCGLTKAADTDNHIVLVDPDTEEPTLKDSEPDSQTAEFTPRVRLTHTGLVGTDLQHLITDTADKALLVRVTGIQMFDSEHSLGRHLKRHNNWEIHPILKLEYCPEDKTCVEDSDANWVDMEK